MKNFVKELNLEGDNVLKITGDSIEGIDIVLKDGNTVHIEWSINDELSIEIRD